MKRKYEVAVRQKALIALERDKLLEQVCHIHLFTPHSRASVNSQEGTKHILLFAMEAQTKSLEQVHMSYASLISQEGTNHTFLHKPHFLT